MTIHDHLVGQTVRLPDGATGIVASVSSDALLVDVGNGQVLTVSIPEHLRDPASKSD